MPQPKRNARPKIDAVIRHIKAGSYDDDMSQLQGAIADRQQIRQERVAQLVEETFGEGYVVAPKGGRLQGGVGSAFASNAELVAAEAAARAREAELAKELSDGLPDDKESSDIESRSPVIGSVPRDEPRESPPERKNPFLDSTDK